MMFAQGESGAYQGLEPIMRLLVRWLLVLVVCLIGIGLYRGWFSFSSHSTEETDKVNVSVSVDKKKMKSDVVKVEKKVQQEIKELEGKGKAK